MGQIDFFISYSSKDVEFAKFVNETLKNKGYQTKIQYEDFGKKDFVNEIHEALSSQARVIALYSQNYFASEYCLKEALTALTGDPFNKNERLIPLKISECRPLGYLANVAYLDLIPLRALDNQSIIEDALLHTVKPGAGQYIHNGQTLWQTPKTILHPEISPVRNFTAREDDLAKLKTTLFSGQTAAVTAAVAAMGGVGKTVLAKQYGWENREAYAGIWWIAADSRANIINSLGELGALLVPGLETVEDREQAAQITLQTLETSGFEKPWLLIYDNVDQKTDLDQLTPKADTHSHILITSRVDNWVGVAEKIDLGLFSEEEAIAFLLKLTGSTDRDGAKELAEVLGYLPLALEQAAAWCRATGFADYLKTYQSFWKKKPQDATYPESVWNTFNLAFEKVLPTCPDIPKLLGPVAYLAPDEIPLDIFPEEYLPIDERVEIVTVLSDVSLVKTVALPDGTQGLSLHRLVQEIIRDQAEESAEAEALKALVTGFVADAFPSGDNDVRFWPQVQRLEPHARTVLEYAPDEGDSAGKTGTLLNQYGLYLRSRADYPSRTSMKRALAIDEASFGRTTANVATGLNNLAQLYQDTNRLEEAEPLMKRALAIDETSFGPDHPEVASDLNNLAGLYQATNRLEEAEPLMKRVIEIFESSYGRRSPKCCNLSQQSGSALSGHQPSGGGGAFDETGAGD